MKRQMNYLRSEFPPHGSGAAACAQRQGGVSPLCLFAKPLPTPSQGRESREALLFNLSTCQMTGHYAMKSREDGA